jgi:hypothetical protein
VLLIVREAHNVREIVILSLGEASGCTHDSCGCGAETPRVPVLACADALRAEGARVELVTATSDAEIDAAVKPVEGGDTLLVVAAATDGELRAVVRRLVRHHSPAPSKRPTELPPGRTMYDLPPVGVLPLTPGVPALVSRIGLPVDPAEVATAVLAGSLRRLDLLRTDSGSATLHGALVGSVAGGAAEGWRGQVEVDDAILTSGHERVLACAITNVGVSDVDGLPLVVDAAADDGLVDVAVAVPVLHRHLLRSATVSVEVRRARGRAVSVTPRDVAIPYVDDGVTAQLTHKRSWWVERRAWSLYVR